jgi:hypothetical protein
MLFRIHVIYFWVVTADLGRWKVLITMHLACNRWSQSSRGMLMQRMMNGQHSICKKWFDGFIDMQLTCRDSWCLFQIYRKDGSWEVDSPKGENSMQSIPITGPLRAATSIFRWVYSFRRYKRERERWGKSRLTALPQSVAVPATMPMKCCRTVAFSLVSIVTFTSVPLG